MFFVCCQAKKKNKDVILVYCQAKNKDTRVDSVDYQAKDVKKGLTSDFCI